MEKEVKEMLKDTAIHKTLVMESCLKLAQYFEELGQDTMAIELVHRGAYHDNSKFEAEELNALASIINDKSCLEDASSQLSELKEKAIALHWKNNSHHPEFYTDCSQMSTLDRAEMACDMHARSVQFKTDLISFFKTRQENRFHFPQEMYEEILTYMRYLVGVQGF